MSLLSAALQTKCHVAMAQVCVCVRANLTETGEKTEGQADRQTLLESAGIGLCLDHVIKQVSFFL